jgi:hypothetical protein
MKYWFSDFKKKKKSIFWTNWDFLSNKNRLLRKKNFRRFGVCRLPWFHGCPYENFVRQIFEKCFQAKDFSFRITEGIVLTGVSFHFWPQKPIPSGSSNTNFWLLFHFQMKYCQFWCFWAWFYAELKRVYFKGSEVQSKATRAQKRNLLVIKFL